MGVHFSSATELWATPWALFRELDAEFGFTVDVCAIAENAKCRRFFSPDEDGLLQRWEGVCWMNPPYGKVIGDWMAKAKDEAEHGATVVCLVPARTDTAWWHDLVWDLKHHQPREGVEVRFLRGRIKFQDSANASAPFPSALIIYRPSPTANAAAA